MNFFLKLLAGAALILASVTAQAGGVRIVGSGGDVVKCTTPEGDLYQVFDIYEGEIIDAAKADFRGLKGSSLDRAQQMAERLNLHGPLLTQLIKKHIEIIAQNTVYIADQLIADVPDSYHFLKPAQNCVMLQAAVQTVPDPQTGKAVYYISGPIWNNLSENHRASLILHEAVFSIYLNYNARSDGYLTEAAARLAQNSSSVREFTWLLISNRIQKLSTLEYFRVLLYGGLEGAAEVAHLFENQRSLKDLALGPDYLPLQKKRFLTLSLGTHKKSPHYKLHFSKSGALENISRLTLYLFKTDELIYISYNNSDEKNEALHLPARKGTTHYYEPNRLSFRASLCHVEEKTPPPSSPKIKPKVIAASKKHLVALARFSSLQSQHYQDILDDIVNQIKWHRSVVLSPPLERFSQTEECARKIVFSIQAHGIYDHEDITDRYKAKFFKGMTPKLVLGDYNTWSQLSDEQQSLLLTQITLTLQIEGLKHGTGPSHYTDDPAEIGLHWAQLLVSSDFHSMSDQSYIQEMHRWDLPFFLGAALINFKRAPGLYQSSRSTDQSLTRLGFNFDRQGGFAGWKISGLPLNIYWKIVEIYNPKARLNALNRPTRLYKSKLNPQLILFDLKPFTGCGALSSDKAFILRQTETQKYVYTEQPCNGF